MRARAPSFEVSETPRALILFPAYVHTPASDDHRIAEGHRPTNASGRVPRALSSTLVDARSLSASVYRITRECTRASIYVKRPIVRGRSNGSDVITSAPPASADAAPRRAAPRE